MAFAEELNKVIQVAHGDLDHPNPAGCLVDHNTGRFRLGDSGLLLIRTPYSDYDQSGRESASSDGSIPLYGGGAQPDNATGQMRPSDVKRLFGRERGSRSSTKHVLAWLSDSS